MAFLHGSNKGIRNCLGASTGIMLMPYDSQIDYEINTDIQIIFKETFSVLEKWKLALPI